MALSRVEDRDTSKLCGWSPANSLPFLNGSSIAGCGRAGGKREEEMDGGLVMTWMVDSGSRGSALDFGVNEA